MRVNLIQEQEPNLSVNWTNIILIVAFFSLFSFLGLRYFFTNMELNNLQLQLNSLEQELSIYTPKIQEYHELTRKINELKAIPILEQEDYFWGDVINEIGYIVPGKMMLNSLQIVNNEIHILGIADNASRTSRKCVNI